MGTLKEHQDKWLHNRDFVGSIDERFTDWLVAAMFYTALHAVETVFAFDKINPHTSHTARNQTLKTVNRYRRIWMSYRPLLEAGRSARYDCEASAWISPQVAKTILARHLYAIEKSVSKLIGVEEPPPPIW